MKCRRVGAYSLLCCPLLGIKDEIVFMHRNNVGERENLISVLESTSHPSPLLDHDDDDFPSTSPEPSALDWDSTITYSEPVQKFLEFECHIKEKEIESHCLNEAEHTHSLSDFVQSEVPKLALMAALYCLHGFEAMLFYKRAIIVMSRPELKGKVSPLEKQGLRYFTPREVANLHSFPKEFGFPDHISIRHRYALLGNSLSIAVVAPLIKYLVSEPLERDIPP
ncbi:hypothetical protein KSS87_001055 [Heliosperma pusillum]|nr:hypothetical protein KSS87_001055 [Heliosperma pusillum]